MDRSLGFASVRTGGLPERKPLSWISNYIKVHYGPVTVAVADIYSNRTIWLTDKEAESFVPSSNSTQLMVLKKIQDASI